MRRGLALAAFLVFAVPASATTTRILAPMDWWPVWSSNPSYVAFTRVYPNLMELKVLNLGTGKVTPIGQSASQLSPTWSANGHQLAYASGGVVYTVDADGKDKLAYRAAKAKSYAPAWRPGSSDLAYLTTYNATNLNLQVAGSLWARNVIGQPAWSPDGNSIAYQRDDGIYVSGKPLAESHFATVANPGPPAWSHNGAWLAWVAHGQLFVQRSDGSLPAVPKLSSGLKASGTPAFSYDDNHVVVDTQQGGWVANTAGTGGSAAKVSGPGIAWSPRSLYLIGSGPRGTCPGHVALRENGFRQLDVRTLTGSCLVTGTARADVIEGTPLAGDVIQGLAGNDQIHANDGHTDTVSCGPGRDTVWADRSDRLTGCEVIHR
jgi:Tol biopolymer transport system component